MTPKFDDNGAFVTMVKDVEVELGIVSEHSETPINCNLSERIHMDVEIISPDGKTGWGSGWVPNDGDS